MVYITNITDEKGQRMDIGVPGKTLTPGEGMEFPDEVADIYGIVAAEKKGFVSIEMVKSAPVGAAVLVDDAEQDDPGSKKKEDGTGSLDDGRKDPADDTSLNKDDDLDDKGAAPVDEGPVDKDKKSTEKPKKSNRKK